MRTFLTSRCYIIFCNSNNLFIASMGVKVVTSISFKASTTFCEPIDIKSICIDGSSASEFAIAIPFSEAFSPFSTVRRTSLARFITLSGTPASFATSIPKLSSVPPRTIRLKNVMRARGTKPAQMEQIEETLLRLSQLVSDFNFIDELDINPLLISEKTGEGIAVDGRIKVRMKEAQEALKDACACGCNCCG